MSCSPDDQGWAAGTVAVGWGEMDKEGIRALETLDTVRRVCIRIRFSTSQYGCIGVTFGSLPVVDSYRSPSMQHL